MAIAPKKGTKATSDVSYGNQRINETKGKKFMDWFNSLSPQEQKQYMMDMEKVKTRDQYEKKNATENMRQQKKKVK